MNNEMGPNIGAPRLYGRRLNQATYDAAAQTFNTAYDKVGVGVDYTGEQISKVSKYIEKASIHTQGYYDAYASERVGKATAAAAVTGSSLLNKGTATGRSGAKSVLDFMSARSPLYDDVAWNKTKGIGTANRAAKKWNAGLRGNFDLKKEGNQILKGGTSAGKFFAKAGMAATVGSGVKRENFMNSLGLLTRHQKAAAKAGGMAAAQTWMMPLGAAVGGAMILSEGGGAVDYAADFMLPAIGATAGWSVGKNLGLGTAEALGSGRFGVLAAGGALGVAGAAVGLAASVAVGELAKSFGDSNNQVNQAAETLKYAKFNSDFDMTKNQLTHRQRTLSKLSKSGLNDRGTLLGNEAQVIAGII